MNGHFEVDNSAYPIGYLNGANKGEYKITDMQELVPLHSQPISLEQAKSIAASANGKVRAGHTRADVHKFVRDEVAGL